MRVLLVGEYSRLHNSLKEGLISLGHEVIIIGDGDGFKNFPVDISIRPRIINNFLIKKLNVLLFKIFKWDLNELERGLRFYFQLSKLKGFDVVQLINERPIKTYPSFERYLLRKIFRNNKKTFLLSCGIDYLTLDYMLQKKWRYCMLTPYFKDTSLLKHFQYMFYYKSKKHLKTHQFVQKNIIGVIASDFDYYFPNKHLKNFIGLIPNPINTEVNAFTPLKIDTKINIFLGINKGNYYAKGISYFEKALAIIKDKFPEKVNVVITTNVPFSEYIKLYNQAHILLDQVFSYDQGYNALEAMAKGKVVFTGAEKEFLDYYKIEDDTICINAKPEVNYLVEKLSFLIENPLKIIEIGKQARNFIEEHHHAEKIAKIYLEHYKA